MELKVSDGYADLQITRFDTKEKICDIIDVFEGRVRDGEYAIFDKVRLNLVEYGPNKKNFKHFLDVDDFMLLARDIAAGNQKIDFKDYKGNPDPKSVTGYEARELLVAFWADGAKGQGAYTLTFRRGPGRPSDTGAVSIDPNHKGEVVESKMILPVPTARKGFNFALEYLKAKLGLVIHKATLEAAKVRQNRATVSA